MDPPRCAVPSLKSRRRIKGKLAPRYYPKQMTSVVNVVSSPVPLNLRKMEIPVHGHRCYFPNVIRRADTRVPIHRGVARAFVRDGDEPVNTEFTRDSMPTSISRPRYKFCLLEKNGGNTGNRCLHRDV